MQIYLSSYTGWADAFQTMFMSRGTWTPELMVDIKYVCSHCLTPDGQLYPEVDSESWEKFSKWRNSLFKFGTIHITLLKFMDFCFVVQGLHRGATDDWDAHAQRFNNRIVRLSTRLWVMASEQLYLVT